MIKHLLLTLSLATALACGVPSTQAAEKKTDKKPAATEKADKPVPFNGKVTAVDASAKTFSTHGKTKDRVFTITEKTVIMKDGAASDLSAIAVGDEVRGSATKSGENWEAVKVSLGAKPAKTDKTDKTDKPATKSEATAPAKTSTAPAGVTPEDKAKEKQ